MKKITSFLMALAMLATVSCSDKGGNPSTADTSSKTVEVRQTIYKESKIILGHQIETPVSMQMCGGKCYYFYESRNEDTNITELRLAVVDGSFSIEKNIAVCDGVSIGYAVNVREDGGFDLVSSVTDFEFERNEYGEITNYDDFLDSGKIDFMLTSYDSSGSVVSENEIIGLGDEFEKSGSRLRSLCPYGEGKLILSYGNGGAVIGTDGAVFDTRRYDMQLVDFGCDVDGSVIASEYHNYGYMDGETLELPESIMGEYEERLELESPAVIGNGGFKAYFERMDGIYGLTEGGELILVFDFSESFVQGSEICCFASCGDGMFITDNCVSSELCIYNRRPDDYTNEREIIDIWQISGGGDGSEAVEFNKANDKYLAKVNPIIKSPDELTKALLTDSGPDVIEFGDADLMNKLRNLGAMADMKTLIDEYGGISLDELMPNVVEAYDMDGSIYALPEYFSVNAMIANSDYIGREYADWTLDDLYRFYDERPEGMYLFEKKWPSTLTTICQTNISHWIDTEAHTCSFDSPDFVRLLEFCRETADSFIPEPDSAWDEDDLLYLKQRFVALRDHTVMLSTADVGGYGLGEMTASIGQSGLTWDTASLLNYPGGDGAGIMRASNCVAVMENSDCKEGAWAYAAYLLSEERQCEMAESVNDAFNLTNKKAFDISLAKIIQDGDEPEMGKISHTNENGVRVSGEYTRSVTSEQAAEYRDFVLNCTRLEYNNWEINNIIYEEYQRYITDEITAEECAGYIQDRVGILLGEA